MGRRKLPEEEKRQLHSLRLDPEDRMAIEAIAKQEGLSFSAVAERHLKAGLQLMAHPIMSPALLAIFVEIMDEMQAIQARNYDKPWHADLATWAACKMIFAKGPFARHNPDDWRSSDAITKLWQDVARARKGKQEAISLLKALGIDINPSPEPEYKQRRGIFGRMNDMLKIAPSNRAVEQNLIEQMQSDNERTQAMAIFGMVKQYDAQENASLEKWYKEVRAYLEEETEGRKLYQEWRREVVQRQLALGEIPHYEDLD